MIKELNIHNCYSHYFDIDQEQNNRIIAEYIWIDGTGTHLRSKAKTLDSKVTNLDEIPEWNFDGSSTGQAPRGNSEIILRPTCYFPDPFRGGDNILVLCTTYRYDLETDELSPANTNFRANASDVFSSIESDKPMIKILQNCKLFEKMTVLSKQQLGWPEGGYPARKGEYFCGVGTDKSHGRVIMDTLLKASLYAGIKIHSLNGGRMPGEWEYEIGPLEGIEAGDHLWLSRYLLARITEDFGIGLTFDSKPLEGEVNKEE